MTRGMGKNLLALWIACLPGILSASCSSKENLSSTPSAAFHQHKIECVHGVCSEHDICECNPCWSGSTCQDYVDRFAPRFLAEEPFFILDAETWFTTTTTTTLRRTNSRHSPTTTMITTPDRGVLFRVEAADDDLGLTCQLGQVGPAATCPCATPRYSVIGKSQKMFYTDEETGDVFLRKGFTLESNTHYLITIQVSTLKVNTSAYKPWKERLTVTLYIRSSKKDNDYNGLENEFLNLDYINTKKQILNDDDDSTITSTSSESIEFSNSFPLPELSLGRMTADSIFRYKRQIKRRTEVLLKDKKGTAPPEEKNLHKIPEFKISFLHVEQPQTLNHVQSRENIKVEVHLELPVMNIETSPPLSFQVQISTTTLLEKNGGLFGLAICSANVSFVGNAISYSSNSTIQNSILKSIGNLPYPNTAIWEWREVSISMSKNEGSPILSSFGNQTRINFELVLLPFFFANNKMSSFPLSNKTTKNMRIDAKIRFLQVKDEEDDDGEGESKEEGEEEEEEKKLEKNILYKKEQQQITTFVNVPILFQTQIENKVNNKTKSSLIRIEMNGPFRIQRGEWKIYTIKVYIDELGRRGVSPTTQKIQLHLDQIGNQTKNTISIQDIQLIHVGQAMLSCCPLDILKSGFQLTCSSKDVESRGGGDWCSISSPLVNLCKEKVGTTTTSTTRGTGTKILVQNKLNSSSDDDEESNVLEFQGIIYGLPDASPDSQFVLRAHVLLLNGLRRFPNGSKEDDDEDEDDTITATATFSAQLEQKRLHVSSSSQPDSSNQLLHFTPPLHIIPSLFSSPTFLHMGSSTNKTTMTHVFLETTIKTNMEHH